MPVTLLYAALLGLVMSVLSIRVPMRRGTLDVPYGDGGDVPLATRIRAFGNFVEYVPMMLLLMGFLELQGASVTGLHLAGGGLLLARSVHALAYRGRSTLSLPEKIGRGIGAMGTWLVLTGLSGWALVTAL